MLPKKKTKKWCSLFLFCSNFVAAKQKTEKLNSNIRVCASKPPKIFPTSVLVDWLSLSDARQWLMCFCFWIRAVFHHTHCEHKIPIGFLFGRVFFYYSARCLCGVIITTEAINTIFWREHMVHLGCYNVMIAWVGTIFVVEKKTFSKLVLSSSCFYLSLFSSRWIFTDDFMKNYGHGCLIVI